jgi:hypothetical protein
VGLTYHAILALLRALKAIALIVVLSGVNLGIAKESADVVAALLLDVLTIP